jgi:NitT/TauT family transport system permease protein
VNEPAFRGRVAPPLFGLHAKPSRRSRLLLAAIPFLFVIIGYGWASHLRHAENPDDKLLPTPVQMVSAVERMAFTRDERSGSFLMLRDTLSSLRRLAIGVTVAALLGLLVGLNMGLFQGLSATASPFVTFLSMVPPLAILPILFITFGVDELAKVMLILIGVFPVIARDIASEARRIPNEQITKALTLGASQLALVYRIVLPQILPRLIEVVRLSLGAAWLFLIASEAIAADDGLGYRVFLVRRYLAMDVILPYVLWITLIGYCMDRGLRFVRERAFPWYGDDE